MRVSHCTRCGRVTMRPQKPFGTRDVSGEASATIAAQPSRLVQDMVRTLTAIGYITVAASTGGPKPAIMETIPVMNMQVTVHRLNMSSIRRRSTPSIAIVQAVLPQSVLKVMNPIPSSPQQ